MKIAFRYISASIARHLACSALFLAATMNAHAGGAARAITIDDIVGLRKIGQKSISSDGQSIAYLVVQAIAARDAYSVRLVVTSVPHTDKHNEIAAVEVPAIRTEKSDTWEDIGSDVTGGIVFAWDPDGQDLTFGIPDHGRTKLFKYSPKTESKKQLGEVSSLILRIGQSGHDHFSYCVHSESSTTTPLDLPSDPAYRYDRSTFHFWDKHPWQDGRGFEEGKRPLFTESIVEVCFRQDEKTHVSTRIPELLENDPLRPATIYTTAGKMALAGKTYRGNPVNMSFVSPDHRHILFGAPIRENEDPDYEGKSVFFVEQVDSESSQTVLFTNAAQREDSIKMTFWAPDSQSVICFRRSLDRTRIVKFNIRDGHETTLLDTPWGIYTPSMSRDGRYLFATREKPNVPKQLCRIDLANGQMILIDDVNPQFKNITLPSFVPVRQTNRYGDELTGYLFVPQGYHGERRLPFVAIRGQAWDSFCDGGTGVEFPGMVMATEGFAVLFFEPSSKHFPPSKAGHTEFSELRFQSPIENLSLLIRDLDEKGWIDNKRTGLAGLSAGADLVDYASGFSQVFSVGSATTGEVYAPANFFLLDEDQVTAFFSNRYSLPYPDAEGLPAWERVSASLNAAKSHMPLLFQPGDGEAPQTIPQHLAWQHAGIPVETYVYPDEGHVKIHPLNRYYVMRRNLQWFNFWLRGLEEPSFAPATEFQSWEQMRDRWRVLLSQRQGN